jgi:hypothetical protein
MKYNIYQIDSEEVQSTNSEIQKKNVQLILNQKDKQPEIVEYLSKIMSAINLSIVNDCTIHYVEQNGNWFNNFLLHASPSKCIFFGVDPAKIGIWFQVPVYRYFTLLENDFLFIDAAETIRTNKEKKSLFWGELQLMFKLK